MPVIEVLTISLSFIGGEIVVGTHNSDLCKLVMSIANDIMKFYVISKATTGVKVFFFSLFFAPDDELPSSRQPLHMPTTNLGTNLY